MVLAQTYRSLRLKPVYLSPCAWKAATTTSDALKLSVLRSNASQLPQK